VVQHDARGAAAIVLGHGRLYCQSAEKAGEEEN
jgi:hypothetical protein